MVWHCKSVSVIHNSNKGRINNHTQFNRHRKEFDQIQHPLMIQALSEASMENLLIFKKILQADFKILKRKTKCLRIAKMLFFYE